MSQSTYFDRDYSTSSRVAITNSFLHGHILPSGWLIKTVPINVTFVEANDTGPGSCIESIPSSNIDGRQCLQYHKCVRRYQLDRHICCCTVLKVFAIRIRRYTSTTSAPSSGSATATAVPTPATYVISLEPNSTEYGSVEAAVSTLPNDSTEKVILIMPGTYTEQININRTGKVTLCGVTSFTNYYSQNQATIQFSYGVSTSAGQDESTPVINSKKTDGSGLALYNINFVNTFSQTRSSDCY
jgi:hypothetical protein